MANNWGISKEVEKHVEARDLVCVYCGVDFSTDPQLIKRRQTWEHIINDLANTSKENIALCCTSCNASKGAKTLENWLKSDYCKNKAISAESVAQVVKDIIPS